MDTPLAGAAREPDEKRRIAVTISEDLVRSLDAILDALATAGWTVFRSELISVAIGALLGRASGVSAAEDSLGARRATAPERVSTRVVHTRLAEADVNALDALTGDLRARGWAAQRHEVVEAAIGTLVQEFASAPSPTDALRGFRVRALLATEPATPGIEPEPSMPLAPQHHAIEERRLAEIVRLTAPTLGFIREAQSLLDEDGLEASTSDIVEWAVSRLALSGRNPHEDYSDWRFGGAGTD